MLCFIFQCVELNNLFTTLIRNTDNFSLVTEPSLALTVFRLVPRLEADDEPVLSFESLNELNRLFYGRISARNDIMLTQTNLNGIFCIRFVTGATRTTEVHVRAAYDILCKEAETSLELWAQSPRDISIKQYPSYDPSPSQLAVVKASGSRDE
jgi:aromatic-L-amino-acid decarboxylase